MNLLLICEQQTGELLERGVLLPAGHASTRVQDVRVAKSVIDSGSVEMVIVERRLAGDDDRWVRSLVKQHPALPVIVLYPQSEGDGGATQPCPGFVEHLPLPLKPGDVLSAVQRGIEYRQRLSSWAQARMRRDTDVLRRRVNVLETLGKVGRSVTASLDLDEVLKLVVDAAVELTGAEEGSLLMLDEDSGELTMRAARNFQDEFVRTFRLPVSDTLAGEVMRTGKPVLLDEKTPQKIKTSYLVKTLIYVPLRARDRIIGVLGVDNRESARPFEENHVMLVSALADYAAIAIENARLFAHTELERRKLEAILGSIQDGVIVVDAEGRVVLVNRVAREMFQLDSREVVRQPVEKVFKQEYLLELFRNGRETFPYRMELELDDKRVVNAQVNQVPGIGLTLTLHDVTTFKELDRIKSEFVSAVSHDLRSPLTAILGYVELLDRVGPLNEKQRAFVQRVQASVSSITELINDLLDLGRIEAGLDERKILLSLAEVIQYSVENFQSQAREKKQALIVDLPADLPSIYGDSVRLRQVIDNLLGNAIRYTPEGGKITVRARAEKDQVILQVSDNGVGIPAGDLPHIFEKFYRASNVVEQISGSGLGLAIVKSIVENHGGRIWVDSVEGEGTTFTIVLPIAAGEK